MTDQPRQPSTCANCGAPLPHDATQCPHCGTYYAPLALPTAAPRAAAPAMAQVAGVPTPVDPRRKKATSFLEKQGKAFAPGCMNWFLSLLLMPIVWVVLAYVPSWKWYWCLLASLGATIVAFVIVLVSEGRRDRQRWVKAVRPNLYKFMRKYEVTREELIAWTEECAKPSEEEGATVKDRSAFLLLLPYLKDPERFPPAPPTS